MRLIVAWEYAPEKRFGLPRRSSLPWCLGVWCLRRSERVCAMVASRCRRVVTGLGRWLSQPSCTLVCTFIIFLLAVCRGGV